MKIFGKVISIVAATVISNTWWKFEQNLASVYAQYRASVRFKIQPILPLTLILAEDRRFYRHGGVDPIAIVRAIWCSMVKKMWTGGSTIEQQLVRTLTGRYERTLYRKVKEILLASLVNRVVPKVDIPGVYLSVAYFGWQMNGIQQVSRRLGIELANIRIHQAASIIARLKYPEPRVPPPQRARQITRRTEFLMKLVVNHCLSSHSAKKEIKKYETILDYRALQ